MNISIIPQRLIAKPSLIRKIIRHAQSSLYRMNSAGADCYAFRVDADGNDFEGGWDWTDNLSDKSAKYLYRFSDRKMYQINE